ncbi:putative transcription coactivator Tc-PD family [Helianthus annuus]|uniref:4a-hydroxytetrahydrobiopterin dehydratase n=1 Tax=Helianthus annuus TaxID=4232 RepID=A0A9K3P085_HELAN|nr:pterin-4-alpha-carbinolamine dehydratase 2, mitochondrial-like [Helianthus annuus]KAF5819214.1 putative transcription coactivator Tc-PD family [Helianthus annuus]KAJ0605398.1 putative transcription coactivator Tc-PD family [Helianthus annuus]KAJ0619419.1 putative transcription coactivator Tc-PD family [Helianthus annuus]KAJ0940717.1 putative transcription coactivator Tc-PD family [Helianthus annuus]KAJ0952474.1 putative transcription coactivator Tc-PD family [Helianthus annuus]
MLSVRRLLPLYVPFKSSRHYFSLKKISMNNNGGFGPSGFVAPDVSSHGSTLRSFCTSKDLSAEKCVPCNRKGLSPMTEDSANALKPKVPEWELLSDGGIMKLRRKWKVKNFLLGLEFFKIVADLAESEGHHPDLHLVGWNNVTIEIWTHACGGLTQNDFILAAKIDKLPVESYLK